ncbi:MAG: ATP synthase F1 subunit epsilon [Pirellulales bacterium]|nr:ATP synthase F1 subunit epsilon [Pirellulales bacterium]
MAEQSQTERSGSGALQCVVVTPETTLLDETASFVAVPLFDGELGIAPGHTPMLGRLGYGQLRIRQDAGEQAFYVDGGFVEVVNNSISVLTNRAVPASDLDVEVAEEQLAAARARTANSPELLDIRAKLELQARAQLRIAKKHEA